MKVTVFFVIIFVIMTTSCLQTDASNEQLAFQQIIDSIASLKIDSAYDAVSDRCDTLQKYRVPYLADSIATADSFAHLNDALIK